MKCFIIYALLTLSLSSYSSSFRIIGHRGAAAHAPENTMPSFDRAFELGLYDIELDIQLSKDQELVLFHDSTLEPKTGMKGKVHDYTWKELQQTEIGNWFDRERPVTGRTYAGTKLSLLTDLFKKYKNHFYYHIEIKSGDEPIPELLLNLLKKHDLFSTSQVTSFYKEQLLRLRKLNSNITICYLIDETVENDVMKAIREAQAKGFQGVALRAPIMTTEHVKLAHELGLFIRAWGIKDKKDMSTALAAGAEGMTIDWPEWLIYETLKKLH